MRMLIVTMFQLRECGQRGGGLGGHPGHDGEWPLIRLSWCPTVDISEAMFGKWLVTMQCPSGQVLYRDGTGHGKPGLGSAWSPGLGKMRSVAAGPQVI